MPTKVACPICKRRVEWSAPNKWRPFCSERCKLIDLGEWAAEKRAIPYAVGPVNDAEVNESGDAS